jgi:hypothetical protein
MRHLSLLALIALSGISLSAHDHGRDPRRVTVIAESPCAPYGHWEGRRWEDRWERHGYAPRHDCVDGVLLRPFGPPMRKRVELRFR